MQNYGYLKPTIKSFFHLFCITKFRSLMASVHLSHFMIEIIFRICATFSLEMKSTLKSH